MLNSDADSICFISIKNYRKVNSKRKNERRNRGIGEEKDALK